MGGMLHTDDAARAGWLYYIAGKTQDDIARILTVSRPTALTRPSDQDGETSTSWPRSRKPSVVPAGTRSSTATWRTRVSRG